jgi:hypothetical protein
MEGVFHMPAFRLSFIMKAVTGTAAHSQGSRTAQFSEGVIWDNVDASTLRSFDSLARKRAALLPASARIIAYRFQQVDPPGRTTSRRVNFPGNGAPETARGQPTDAVRISYQGSGVQNTGKRSIACIPDTMISDGEYNPIGFYQIAMLAFLTELNGWKFRGADLTLPKVNVKTVSAPGVVETVTDLVVAAGDRVRLYSVVLANGKKHSKTYVVQEFLTPRTFQLKDYAAGAATSGQARKYVPIYPIITGAPGSPIEASTRKVGRPTTGYRGRVSRRRN